MTRHASKKPGARLAALLRRRLFLAALAGIAAAPAHAAVPDTERAALIDLYGSTNGVHWIRQDNWNGPPGTECTWFGITCDASGSNVIGIDLSHGNGQGSVNMTGALPTTLRNLTALETFNVSHNNIGGPLPPVAGWTSLVSYDVSQNAFTGPIPPLTALPNLQVLIVSVNNLTGPIPHFDEVPSLTTFEAATLGLTGPIPSLADVPLLVEIDVSSNFLTGQIPALGGLAHLEHFDARANSISGGLPALAGLDHLVFFDAAGNRLSGPIPALSGLGALGTFIVDANHLEGSLPSLDGLDSLSVFDASDNLLTGELPELAGLTHLTTFNVSNNTLTGAVPSLDGLNALVRFYIDHNALTGDLPAAPRALAFAGVCPNALNPAPDPAWDEATGVTPWYADCNAGPVNLNQFGLSGGWYDPAASGQGIVISALPDLLGAGHGYLFGGWFTFAAEGAAGGPREKWYTFQGNADAGAAEADLGLYETTDGSFVAPPTPTTDPIGSVTFAPVDCTHVALSYHFDDGRSPDGTIALQRVAANTTCTQDGLNPPPGSNSLLSGGWYDPAISGQGLVFDIVPSQATLFAAWYTFAPNAAAGDPAVGQRWYVLQSGIAPGGTSAHDIDIYTLPNGSFGHPAGPLQHVGDADITFQSCTALTLTYTLHADDGHDYSGTQHLVRLGNVPAGCTDLDFGP
jgi:hypothetical protein